MLAVIILLICHWYLSLFCQTFYLHRYSAHHLFTMNRFWDRFFFLLTYLCQGPSFLNPKAYSILHQRHHSYSDTEKDPHSPHFFKNAMDMMIETYHQYQSSKDLKEEELESFIDTNYPIWNKLEKFADFNITKVLWGFLYLGIYLLIDPPLYMYAFLPLHFIMGPIQGAIVNYCGHKLGYRNYELPDKSVNTLPQDILLMGELYQNNHHKHPRSLNFAKKWFEIDPTYWIMKVMNIFGVIKIKNA